MNSSLTHSQCLFIQGVFWDMSNHRQRNQQMGLPYLHVLQPAPSPGYTVVTNHQPLSNQYSIKYLRGSAMLFYGCIYIYICTSFAGLATPRSTLVSFLLAASISRNPPVYVCNEQVLLLYLHVDMYPNLTGRTASLLRIVPPWVMSNIK